MLSYEDFLNRWRKFASDRGVPNPLRYERGLPNLYNRITGLSQGEVGQPNNTSSPYSEAVGGRTPYTYNVPSYEEYKENFLNHYGNSGLNVSDEYIQNTLPSGYENFLNYTKPFENVAEVEKIPSTMYEGAYITNYYDADGNLLFGTQPKGMNFPNQPNNNTNTQSPYSQAMRAWGGKK